MHGGDLYTTETVGRGNKGVQYWERENAEWEEAAVTDVIGCYNTMDKYCHMKIKVTDHLG